MISSTYGSWTDLRPIPSGVDPMYMEIHICPSCGYTGYDGAFKQKHLDKALKERMHQQITPLIKDFILTPKKNLLHEFPAPERQYRIRCVDRSVGGVLYSLSVSVTYAQRGAVRTLKILERNVSTG